jgi:hypothetical protein
MYLTQLILIVSEETSEDVRGRARAIQENEIQQLRDLTNFLDIEINFVQQYLEVLQDVKSNWCDVYVSSVHVPSFTDYYEFNDRSTLSPVELPRGHGPTHIFPRTVNDSKSDSGHSKKSAKSGRSDGTDPSDSDGDEATGFANQKSGKRRRSRSGSRPGSRPPSRPTSRASRKRTDSEATAGGTEKDKGDKSGKRISVADWASNAVSSMTGRAKKDKDQFASLVDDDSDDDGGRLRRSSSSISFATKHSKSKSKESLSNASPRIPTRISKPLSLQGKKLVRALHDFTGSTDELTFKAGDEIVVLNEVLDGWWMGELDSQKGLFPTAYTVVISTSPSKTFASYRPEKMGSSLTSAGDHNRQFSLDGDGYITSDLEDNHLFGDPLAVIGRSPQYGNFDAESVTDSVVEEDEEKRLMPVRQASQDEGIEAHTGSHTISQLLKPPIIPPRSTPNSTQVSIAKKTPPPPPPRRSAPNVLAPPIPQRRQGGFQSRSSGSLHSSSPQSSSVSSLGHEVSPFESATELSVTGCQNFRQNPFKPPGMCSNCLQVHV